MICPGQSPLNIQENSYWAEDPWGEQIYAWNKTEENVLNREN